MIYNMFFNLFPTDHLIKKLVILGFMINVVVLIVTYIISFGTKVNKFILEKGIKIASKIKLVKNEETTRMKLKKHFDSFHENAIELKKEKNKFIWYIMINTLSLFVLYSMPFIITIGLGEKITLINTIVATAYIMIIGSFVPIPGGTGGIEYGFIFFFSYFIKGSILNAIMLVWRFVSYYMGMILGAIALAIYRKKEKSWE